MSAVANDVVPVMRPQLPPVELLVPYLKQLDESRYYSNHGSLLRELQTRFAAFFGVGAHQAAVVANGTVALSAALVALDAKPGGRCLLPSWTFVGSAAAVWAANLRPHFVDVNPATWMLEPADIEKRSDLHDVSAVMVISAFGSPVDTAAWDAFTERTGIPVIIDCAASFDTVQSVSKARPARSPIMISLHATKAFGVGEGGLVLSTDDEFMQRFNKICNFGVWETPGQILGYNGKQSEYHAAVGLAALDGWPARRTHLEELTKRYMAALSEVDGLELLPSYGDGWVSCYCNVVAKEPAAAFIAHLHERGIATRRWWQSGVHVQQAYQEFSRDPLPVTEAFAERVFGLPFFHDMSDAEFDKVIAAVKEY